MSAPTWLLVDRAIRYARLRSKTADYQWPTARSALVRILTDLESRDPADPSLDRLRRFIAEGDRAARPPGEGANGFGSDRGN